MIHYLTVNTSYLCTSLYRDCTCVSFVSLSAIDYAHHTKTECGGKNITLQLSKVSSHASASTSDRSTNTCCTRRFVFKLAQAIMRASQLHANARNPADKMHSQIDAIFD
jgi:hypothetical protein